jgi:hypothetical protein
MKGGDKGLAATVHDALRGVRRSADALLRDRRGVRGAVHVQIQFPPGPRDGDDGPARQIGGDALVLTC